MLDEFDEVSFSQSGRIKSVKIDKYEARKRLINSISPKNYHLQCWFIAAVTPEIYTHNKNIEIEKYNENRIFSLKSNNVMLTVFPKICVLNY